MQPHIPTSPHPHLHTSIAHMHIQTSHMPTTHACTHTSVTIFVSRVSIPSALLLTSTIASSIMWAIFCQSTPPAGWRKVLSIFGIVTLAQGPQEPPEGHSGQQAPRPGCHKPCPCCYYTTALKDKHDERLCGWRWSSTPHPHIPGWQEGWVWWHGDAPHCPYRFRRTSTGPPPYLGNEGPHGLDGAGSSGWVDHEAHQEQHGHEEQDVPPMPIEAHHDGPQEAHQDGPQDGPIVGNYEGELLD